MPSVSEWAQRLPDAPAVISPSGDRTFAELDRNANRLARALRSRGLVAGDAVALLCGNGPEFVEVVQATQRAGFRLTPINWHLTADEAAYIVADCEARAVIADGPRAAVAGQACAASEKCEVTLTIGESYEDALDAESGDPLNDPAPGTTMLYT